MTDRTQEFLKFVQENILNETPIPSALYPQSSNTSSSFSSSSSAPSSSGKANNNKKYAEPPKTKSAFIEAASEIAKGIQQTSKVLSKLTKLVRRQGLFDDPTEEINNLVYRIKEDLNELNTKCDVAQQYVDMNKKNNNSSNPFSSSNHNNNSSQSSQASNHSLKVVGSLKTELMNATKDFKNVLEVRSTKIKDQQKRKTELTGSSALALAMTATTNNAPLKAHNHNSPRHDTNGKLQSSQPVLNRFNTHQLPTPYHTDNNTNNRNGNTNNNNNNDSNSRSTVIAKFNPNNDIYSNGNSSNSNTDNSKYNASFSMHNNSNHEEQQLLLAPPPATQLYYEQREQAVSEVEKTIVELGTLFKRLSGMIAEQGEMVERVDEDVENAISNADRAHTILTTMYDNASSNTSLYTKLIAILVFFIIMFVLFLM